MLYYLYEDFGVDIMKKKIVPSFEEGMKALKHHNLYLAETIFQELMRMEHTQETQVVEMIQPLNMQWCINIS